MLGLAAQQHPGQTASSMRGHDDQVTGVLLGNLDDGIGNEVRLLDDSLRIDAGSLGRTGDAVDDGLGRFGPALLLLRPGAGIQRSSF